MRAMGRRFLYFSAIAVICCILSSGGRAEDDRVLPEFGRDTILVWETQVQDASRKFVVRIANFFPNLLMEWEDTFSQGTVFIPNQDILQASGYVNKTLFKQGVDTRSDNETTLWLSRKIFRSLKENKEAKCSIDHVPGKMTYEGNDALAVNVNGSPVTLPAIKVRDNRGTERWFLDCEENPLLLKYELRIYCQKLISITTNRRNTLRWLKGTKLQRLLTE
jgi:hypothetical protein